MTDPANRDYAAEVADAVMSDDHRRVVALAIELAGLAQAAERQRAKTRARVQKHRGVTLRNVTDGDVTVSNVTTVTPSAPSPQGSPSFPTPHITPPSPSSPATPEKPGAAKPRRRREAEPSPELSRALDVLLPRKPYVALAVEAWNGRYGAGSASGGKIAGALGQLVRAGHPEVLVVERWERFVASDESRYGPEYFRQHFADYAESATVGVSREIPAADMGRARSCGAVVETAFRDRGIDREKSEWWTRIKADAKRLSRHPVVLAFEQLHTLPNLTSNGNGNHA